MQLRNVVWIAVMGLVLTCLGCAGSSKKALSLDQTILSLKPAKGYVKKLALVEIPVLKDGFAKQAGALYYKTLLAAFREEAAEVQLLTPDDADFPDFMTALAKTDSPVNPETLALAGRKNGFNGLITTALRDIRAVERKSGILWFRKPIYRLEFELTLEMYDPFTGAKLLSVLEESTVKIDEAEFLDYKGGSIGSIEQLDEALVDIAEEVGELAAETVKEQPWLTSVVRVDNERIYLSAGQLSGLQQGQRLAVVTGRRFIEGGQGEKFIAPGERIGEIVITSVDDQMAEAKADSSASIEAGDIAYPIKR